MMRARLRTSVGLVALLAIAACGTEFSPLVPEGADEERTEPTGAGVSFDSRQVGDSVELRVFAQLRGWPLADPSDAVHLGVTPVPWIRGGSPTQSVFRLQESLGLSELPPPPFPFTVRAPDGSSNPDLEVEFPALLREPGTAEICLGEEDLALRYDIIGTLEGDTPAWRLTAVSVGSGNSGGRFFLAGLGIPPSPFPLAREVLVALGARSVIELSMTAGASGTRGGIDTQVVTSLSTQWLVTVSELADEPCAPAAPQGPGTHPG